MPSLPERVRSACAAVAARATAVRVERGAIVSYADSLGDAGAEPGLDPGLELRGDDREALAGYVICLDAINFGSGWWPTIRKLPGRSGYTTIAAALADRFREKGPWSAAELAELAAADVARALGQDRGHPLMGQYAEALRDVGARLAAEHGGSFLALIDAAAGSAVDLAGLLAEWSSFADVSRYGEIEVPFFKRAQLAPADVNRAGVARLAGVERLTAFADNLVPHVLRLDGVLALDPGLAGAIDSGELLVHGSAGEVELRACAVHAVELLAAATRGRLAPATIDALLWNRGQGARYKAVPRPRSRNTAY